MPHGQAACGSKGSTNPMAKDMTAARWRIPQRLQRHVSPYKSGNFTLIPFLLTQDPGKREQKMPKAAPGDDPAVPGLWKPLPQSQELVISGRGPGSESALSAVCNRRLRLTIYSQTHSGTMAEGRNCKREGCNN